MNRKRTLLAVAGALTLLAVVKPVSADIRVITHDVSDAAPRRVQTALHLGIVAFNVLVTWSDRTLR